MRLHWTRRTGRDASSSRPATTPFAMTMAFLSALCGHETAAAQTPPSGTIIVSNMDARTTSLIDLSSGEVRAVVDSRADPHEVALSRDGRTAIVTNYGAPGPGNLLQVLDVPSGTVLREIELVGRERLHGVTFLPGDSLLAVTSERTSELLVVGFGDGGVRSALPTLGGAPHMLAGGGGWLWAANITGGSLARLDPNGRTASMAWPAGERTEGVATTPDGTEGWTGSMSTGTVVGIDAETGERVATVTGLGVPYRLAVTPDGRHVVVTDPGRERLVLIDRTAGSIAAEIDIGLAAATVGLGSAPSPQGFTITPDGEWALVSAKAIDRVAVVHLPSRRVTRFIETGAGPDGIGFSPRRVER